MLETGLIPYVPYHSSVPAKDHRELTPTRQFAWIRYGCLDQEAGDQGLAPFVIQWPWESYFHFDGQIFHLQRVLKQMVSKAIVQIIYLCIA